MILYHWLGNNNFQQICVTVTPTPFVADDMPTLKSIFDAISDDEGSARGPVVPTSPYSGDINPALPAVSWTDSRESSLISRN
jgi:hypothetical protein